METALLSEGRRRLLPAAGPVGCVAQDVARVLGAAEHRLGGAVLSAGQLAAAHGPALRWLPFGELQRADENSHRVERRLRALPRSPQRAREAAVRVEHPEPG